MRKRRVGSLITPAAAEHAPQRRPGGLDYAAPALGRDYDNRDAPGIFVARA